MLFRSYLKKDFLKFSKCSEDGRLNSSVDEIEIINKLVAKFGSNIICKSPCRMWHDMQVFDTFYGWIPVNIKSTTTITADNTGNLAMCVYAYTDEQLCLNKMYKNGDMAKLLFEKLKKNELNFCKKKDYFFLILNKTNKDVIINSVKGLSVDRKSVV